MTPVTRRLAALAVTVLAGMGSGRAAAPADERFVPLAHSAQLTVDAAMLAPDTLTLRIRGANHAALTAAQVEVAAQGHSLPVTANTEGTWTVAMKELGGKPPGKLDLVVSHDGIRELLSGTLAPPPAASAATGVAAGLLGNHKQLAWWILNIAIVLIAAIAISRRMK
jgi:hypothetical protein